MFINFSNKYGKPEDTMFVIGDYDTGSYNMKGIEPIICKRIRRIFKNAGYESYLINEYCTSKFCNCCHNELDKFLIRKSNKPKDIMKNKNIQMVFCDMKSLIMMESKNIYKYVKFIII